MEPEGRLPLYRIFFGYAPPLFMFTFTLLHKAPDVESLSVQVQSGPFPGWGGGRTGKGVCCNPPITEIRKIICNFRGKNERLFKILIFSVYKIYEILSIIKL